MQYFKKIFMFLSLVSISLPIFAVKYNTNFMYINREINQEKYVFPELRKKIVSLGFGQDFEDWNVKVIDWISEWLKQNPQGDFVFWYDKNTVTEDQVERTNGIFKDLANNFLKEGTLVLKDIASLTTVKENARYFTQEIPIYLRLDLLRIIAMLEYVEKCKDECASVYADIDKGIKSISGNKIEYHNLSADGLFDDQTKSSLKKYSLVMRTGPENSFIMISNQNPHMIEALKTVVIKSNLKHIDPLLQRERDLKQNLSPELQKLPLVPKLAQFDKIDQEMQAKIKDFAIDYIGTVFNTMSHGHLMVYFRYLQKEVGLMINANFITPGQGVDYADVFSRLNPREPIFAPSAQYILQYFSTQPGLKNFAAAKSEADDIIESYTIPTKDIGGSRSTSYTGGW